MLVYVCACLLTRLQARRCWQAPLRYVLLANVIWHDASICTTFLFRTYDRMHLYAWQWCVYVLRSHPPLRCPLFLPQAKTKNTWWVDRHSRSQPSSPRVFHMPSRFSGVLGSRSQPSGTLVFSRAMRGSWSSRWRVWFNLCVGACWCRVSRQGRACFVLVCLLVCFLFEEVRMSFKSTL